MKVAALSYSDAAGGAAVAAYRIHHAVRRGGIDSTMRVCSRRTDDWTVRCHSGGLAKLGAKLGPWSDALFSKVRQSSNKVVHSAAVWPTDWSRELNVSDVDVVHLHWVNGGMMSIADVSRLSRPVVWTLHDMWAFCGAEHYSSDLRWQNGYERNGRPADERGLDLNRFVWQRKFKRWIMPRHIVAPSRWMAKCVQSSMLMRNWPVSVIPNAIDTEVWAPCDRNIARTLLNLPTDGPLVLFGAMKGASDPRKGFDLLKDALGRLHSRSEKLQLVVFGQSEPRNSENLGFPVHYMGHLSDATTLKLLYSAADVMVIPSRQDNLPNTGVESLACGTPVVAFDSCGLPDIVEHGRTGYLARAFDTDDLANGVAWVLEDDLRRRSLCRNARQKALIEYSYPVVANQYIDLYGAVMASASS